MEIENLSNGGKSVIFSTNKTDSVTVLILTRCGSRLENPKTRGIAHFLEHLFFKGGEKFKNSREVAAAIDAVGGEFNAFTGKEYTGFFVKTAKENFQIAVEVLSDMLLRARFDAAEIEKERGVILQELAMYEDIPMYQVGWNFENLLFGENSMGWDQIGTRENILNFSRDDFVNFKNKFYKSETTFFVVAGNVDENSARKTLSEKFQFSKKTDGDEFAKFSTKKNFPKISIKNKKTEQAHLIVGFPGVEFGNENEIATRLLSIILGGNMSSRMFQKIRDEKGLCYSIRTTSDHFSDCGVFSTHAGVAVEKFDDAICGICEQYFQIATRGISDLELQNAKNFLRGKLTLSFEDTEEIASFIGTNAVLKNRISTIENFFAKMEKVSRDEVEKIAREIISPKKIAVAAIAPFENYEQKVAEILGKFS